MAVARRLREAGIKVAAASAGNGRPDSVEHASVLLILVETVVQERAQEAATLRDSKAESSLDVIMLIGQQRLDAGVLEKRHGVAHGRGSQSNQHRIFGHVDDFVNLPRLET